MSMYSVDIDSAGVLIADIDILCDNPMQAAVKVCIVNSVRYGYIDVYIKYDDIPERVIAGKYIIENGIIRDLYNQPDECFGFLKFVFNIEIMDRIIRNNPGLHDIVLFEEMSELQKVLCKYRRNKGNYMDLVEETAHVLICIKQICRVYDIRDELIQNEIFKKIKKYADRP